MKIIYVGDDMNSVETTIINTAITLFAKKGYAATSIRDIASSVDMKSASLYYYMKNKKDLLMLIMDRYLIQLISGAEAELSELNTASANEKLKGLIKYHVRSHGNEQLAALVVDTEYRSLEGNDRIQIKQLRKKYEKIWTNLLEEGESEGVFHFEDKHVSSFAIISLCTGVAHWYRNSGRLSVDEVADKYAILGSNMVLCNK